MSARVWQEAGAVDWEAVLRHAPLRDAAAALGCRLPVWEQWIDDPSSWRSLDLTDEDRAAIDLPVLHLMAWDDTSGLARYRDGDVLVLGDPDVDALHKDWFTHWLKDPAQERPSSRVFVTGVDAWRDETWVPASRSTSLHLGSRGALGPAAADSAVSFRYDPSEPVVLTPDLVLFPSAPRTWAAPPRDRRFLERRPDVLVWTGEAATERVELAGRPTALLRVSSDRPDTDVFLQLTDVAPSGQSLVVATGGLRVRSRDGADREVLLTPGEVAELPVELSAVCHVLLPGHRLRLSLTSSWFPLVDRNLNTGAPVGTETEPLVATTTVHPGSRLDLPVRSAS
jgi:putative CocE/NonD family hydrolase